MSAALALPVTFSTCGRNTDNRQETAGICIHTSYINLNLIQLQVDSLND